MKINFSFFLFFFFYPVPSLGRESAVVYLEEEDEESRGTVVSLSRGQAGWNKILCPRDKAGAKLVESFINKTHFVLYSLKAGSDIHGKQQ